MPKIKKKSCFTIQFFTPSHEWNHTTLFHNTKVFDNFYLAFSLSFFWILRWFMDNFLRFQLLENTPLISYLDQVKSTLIEHPPNSNNSKCLINLKYYNFIEKRIHMTYFSVRKSTTRYLLVKWIRSWVGMFYFC